MFKETFTVLAIIGGLVATSAQAREHGSERWAGHGGGHTQTFFAQIDQDGNGKITPAEIQAQAVARFAAADADGNGALTAQEMATGAQNMRKARLLARFDTDGDGALSAQELEGFGADQTNSRAAKRFGRMDADNSGGVTLEEMQARQNPARMLTKRDTNGDGALSFEEFSAERGHGKDRKMKHRSD